MLCMSMYMCVSMLYVMCACMYVCTHACMHVRMYVCVLCGSLDRAKHAAEQRLADVQHKVKNTVPKEDWNKLRHEHMLLQEKYKILIDKEQSAMQV